MRRQRLQTAQLENWEPDAQQQQPEPQKSALPRRYSVYDFKPSRVFLVDIEDTTKRLLLQEDTNKDCQITIEDTGPKTFKLGTESTGGVQKHILQGNYPISTLLQELALASTLKQQKLLISEGDLFQSALERINRIISQYFWFSLTRTVDEEGIELVCLDAKYSDSQAPFRIYVPSSDTLASGYFEALAKKRPFLEVVPIPPRISSSYLEEAIKKPGLLSLKLVQLASGKVKGVPFVVPGGRFNEMYGWDSYFIALGLLEDHLVDLAKGMVDNLLYEVQHYGKVLNANRSYFLARSQPPFLTDMILKVYSALEHSPASEEWLKSAFCIAIREYRSVWLKEPRFVPAFGLSRYCSELGGVSPETESSHFDGVFAPFAKKMSIPIDLYRLLYQEKTIREPALDEYFFHDQSVRESGHDTTYRLDSISAHLLSMDLNFLLYKYEVDIATFLQSHPECDSERESVWFAKAAYRKSLIDKFLWNEEKGLYFDYDFVHQSQLTYKSVTNFYALWSGAASAEQAKRIIQNLPSFECKGGLASGSKDSVLPTLPTISHPNRQWDYPYGWAPHQIIAWQGLKAYDFREEASRLSYRWLYMISKIFSDFNGTLVEKYDVVRCTHKIDVEYGNVGADFKFVPKEGFGWVNASYRIGQLFLEKRHLIGLGALIDPGIMFSPPCAPPK